MLEMRVVVSRSRRAGAGCKSAGAASIKSRRGERPVQKARHRPRQMRSMKANASEPLTKGRNSFQTVSKPGLVCCPGSSAGGGLFATDTTPGLEAARAWIRLRHGTLEPVASMQRERPKRTNREAESTERRAERSSARHRGGTTRSSAEAPVTGVERRGRVIQFSGNGSTASVGGTHG